MQDVKRSTVARSLEDFCHDFGVPNFLTFDSATNQKDIRSEFMSTIRKHHIDHHVSSPRRYNENSTEGIVRILKTRWYRIMMKKRVP